MRILFCAQQAPLPPPDGFRLYLDALARGLRAEHDVRILAYRTAAQLDDPSVDHDMRLLPLPRRRSPQWVVETSLSLGRGVVLRRPMKVDEMARRLRKPLIEEIESFKPDVVHVTTGSLAALGRYLQGTPTILAALDAWHLNVEAWVGQARGLRRSILQTESKRVRRFEANDFARFDRVVVVTDEDREALLSVNPGLKVDVIPNGVHVEKFASEDGSVRRPGRIIFTGVMSYAPNVAAAETLAREVLPAVRKKHPEAHLEIIGRRPNARVQALGDLEGVEVTGEVDEMAPWLSSGAVYVCPMVSGTGIKNKLLEAMANGLPCVATPLAVQGLEVESGKELLLGDDPGELAAHVNGLLDDPSDAARLGDSARSYVTGHHSWAAVARAYEQVYSKAITPN